MPTLDENLKKFNSEEDWNELAGGEQWSDPWGNTESLWHFVILPRIHAFLPAAKGVEIAPGHGRWTQYLKDQCGFLTLVDLAPHCIEVCKRRFATNANISYVVNSGSDLPGVPDHSADFVFSFDSLVHAESDVMCGYLREIARVLAPNGVAFLHHSNSGVYASQSRLLDKVSVTSAIGRRIHSWFPFRLGWRARSVTAEMIREKSHSLGLNCFRQERISWETGPYLRDSLSTLTRKGSAWDKPPILIDNPAFAAEANYVRLMSTLYSTRIDGA
jgi:ubiquinone/menaquinone biosynthesis C-methylase UbiE